MIRELSGRAVARLGALAALLSVLPLAGCSRNSASGAHDLLLISVDTLRADRLGCWGDPDARTPFWDRLARSGTQFRTTVATAPFTLPSHATMLTGRHPFEHRVRHNSAAAFEPPGRTLAEMLRQAGFATAAFTASVVLDSSTGIDRGFETFEWRDSPEQTERPAGAVVSQALDWVRPVAANRPVFLFVHLYDPHDPYEPPAPWEQLYAADPYRGEIAATDRQLLRLLRGWERARRPRETLIVATADHGEAFGEHGETGHGFFVYDATLRVPLVVSGVAPFLGHGTRSDVARGIDLVPTILGVLGLPSGPRLPGRDLATPPRPGEREELTVYAETFEPTHGFGASDLRAVRRAEWKYIRAPREELYDLDVDPGETRNLFDQEPERAAELSGVLADLVDGDLRHPAGFREDAEIDEARAEQLAALGYAAAGGDAGSPGGALHELRDPKDLVGIPEKMDRAIPLARDEVWDEAIPILEEVIAQDPQHAEAIWFLARARFARGEEGDAFGLWETALVHAPRSPRLWLDYGTVLLQRGRPEQAVPALERAVELRGADVDARVRLATAALRTGDLGIAAEQTRAARALDPADERARRLERQLQRRGALPEAGER